MRKTEEMLRVAEDAIKDMHSTQPEASHGSQPSVGRADQARQGAIEVSDLPCNVRRGEGNPL